MPFTIVWTGSLLYPLCIDYLYHKLLEFWLTPFGLFDFEKNSTVFTFIHFAFIILLHKDKHFRLTHFFTLSQQQSGLWCLWSYKTYESNTKWWLKIESMSRRRKFTRYTCAAPCNRETELFNFSLNLPTIKRRFIKKRVDGLFLIYHRMKQRIGSRTVSRLSV